MAKKSLLRLNVNELEKVKVLRASGFTFHAISRKLGRDHKTIKKACERPKMAAAIEEIKEELSDFFEGLARRMITSISDNDIKRTPPYQRVISSGICIDKMRLLRGHSTENLNILQIIERIERDGMSRKREEKAVPEKAVPQSP